MKRFSRTEGGWEKERTRDKWKSKEDDAYEERRKGKGKDKGSISKGRG